MAAAYQLLTSVNTKGSCMWDCFREGSMMGWGMMTGMGLIWILLVLLLLLGVAALVKYLVSSKRDDVQR